MTRRTKYLILSVIFTLSVVLSAALWLLATPGGARWIVEFLSQRADVRTEIRKVKGSFIGGLDLEGISVSLPQVRAGIKNVRLRWLPLSLLAGSITLKELHIFDVVIQDNRPARRGPPDLAWPLTRGLLATIRASIETFRVNGFKYKTASGPPVEVSDISARIELRGGRLGVDNLLITASTVSIKGGLSAGFKQPSLTLDLAAELSAADAGVTKIVFDARLAPAMGPEQVSGPVTVTAISRNGPSELSGEIGLTRASLILRRLKLRQPVLQGDIGGEGEIIFPEGSPFLLLRTKLTNLNLSRQVHAKTDIGGVISFEGGPSGFRGRFTLSNVEKGPAAVSLSGTFKGGGRNLELSLINGSWLEGNINGRAAIGWGEKISVSGGLEARGLNPEVISPDWKGLVNLVLEGGLQWSRQTKTEAHVSGRLVKSRLRGRALTGEVRASMGRTGIVIDALNLRGKGFDIHAGGALNKRIAFAAYIRDLSGLVPGTKGMLRSQGWLSFSDGIAAVEASGRGGGLSISGTDVKTFSFGIFVGNGKDRPLRLRADIRSLAYGRLRIARAELNGKGSFRGHRITARLSSGGSAISASFSGSYESGDWTGRIAALSGKDKAGQWRLQSPADLRISKKEFHLSPLTLKGSEGERLEIEVKMARDPLAGHVAFEWNTIKVDRFDEWLRGISVSGESSGKFTARWEKGDLRLLEGSLEASGKFRPGKQSIAVKQAVSKVDWNERGLLATVSINLGGGGGVDGRFSSSSPLRMSVPENGDVLVRWRQIDPYLFSGWIPKGVDIKGRISGQLKGKILNGRSLDVIVTSDVLEGSISWRHGGSRFSAGLKKTSLSAAWRGDELNGKVDITLADLGYVKSAFKLPLPARLPAAPNPEGKLSVSANGRLNEKGMLTAVFPGVVQEISGETEFEIDVGGTWKRPVAGGHLRIEKAGAYLPSAGIRLKDVNLSARLEDDRILIDSFKAESGAGSIGGTAVIFLSGWSPSKYRGNIKGERLQTIYLPELRMLTSPDISFEGTFKTISVRGEIIVPELIVQSGGTPAAVKPSKDVIVMDARKHERERLPIAIDIRIKVALGEDVTVREEGLDVQLGGSVDLTAEDPDNIMGKGVIRIVKGKYSAYGLNLDIKRGRITFDGPAYSPSLDVLALRKVQDVNVGVLVSGTIQSPVIRLYSQPAMADADIMSYLVLGHPPGGGSEELSLVSKAAGLLLSKSDSASLDDQLRRRLGLDTLDIESETGGISRSLVTVGKYLTPDLYISLGRSLFSNANILRLRYKFSRHWEVETQSGAESGGDIFYTIEFK